MMKMERGNKDRQDKKKTILGKWYHGEKESANLFSYSLTCSTYLDTV